ncbi:hypothetical protein Htur_3339 [Haloterrigena turkmenica DSM 5511]|uniref:Uncharacterized protein n=1 Tax=Haloterrigena turkmenica (strain ATCC 51198 / DSM 5511 / JCM 9101 / NCIMB 13204 / VKM B-1734 / 4k) TaxID=543526 RepID=D2RPQ1_HALTV|nr:hypothetical protein [Haloterrigena turkmenica]ADB62203.1 hypothetical protein Htur_3339 [Haloterrigena turkmenica DSM 5511]
MQFRTLAVVAVALLVALSGCAALEGVTTDDSPNETDAENGTNITSENGDAQDTETDVTDPADEDETATAEWRPPEEPNRPLENKREDRIESVSVVDTEPAEDGDGYSNFNLEVVANTSMENVDPAEHGDVEGEPYFFVKINEGPGDRKIVERTGEVQMKENGTFHIDVRPAGLEEFGEGSLTVEVFLMDEDKDWDDIYDAVATEVEFNPETEDGETDAETDDGSENDSETDDGTGDESEIDGNESETDGNESNTTEN